MNAETKVTAEMTIREIAEGVLEFSVRSGMNGRTYIADWLDEKDTLLGMTIGQLADKWDGGLD